VWWVCARDPFVKAPAALLLACLTVLPVLATSQSAPAVQLPDPINAGQRIYREGILPSGESLRGAGQAGVVLSGKAAACATCHRRSGYGSSEGPIEVKAITGPALFGDRMAPRAPASAMIAPPSTSTAVASVTHATAAEAARARAQALRAERAARFEGTRPRPVYDEATLARAIRAGIDVSGRIMDATMPRFALDDASMAALNAYLHTLSTSASPGVAEDTVHFGTVIQPGVDQARERALVDLLRTFFHDRNLGQRAELRRELAGQVRLGRTYRDWVLDVWELKGPSDTWDAQLEEYYRKQPVFALVSGLGRESWRPIHEFSERRELPCIFPQTDLPVVDGQNVYTVYLSEGVNLEARALGKFLRDAAEPGRVVQIFDHDAAGVTAARAFRVAMAGGQADLQDQALKTPPDSAYWKRLAHESPGATLVLWLGPDSLKQARSLTAAGSPFKAVYLSSALTGTRYDALMPDPAGRVRLIYPQDPPSVRDARLAVVKQWMRNNRLELIDEQLQFNSYLAATVTGMLVMHSKDTYSRDFLLERLEHRLGTSLELSIYPHLSLGPGQRFASKGSYLVKVEGGAPGRLSLASDWIVP
jgi:cytochrome c553